VEPIRTLLSDKRFKFCQAAALRVEPESRRLLCRAADSPYEAKLTSLSCPLHTFSLEYDQLVIACGSVPNTFSTPGVEVRCSAPGGLR